MGLPVGTQYSPLGVGWWTDLPGGRYGTGTGERYRLVRSLTAPPGGVAQLEVSAGARRVLPAAVGAQHVLDLPVDGLEGGVHLHVVLPQGAGRLVGPHVAQGVRGLLRLREAGEGGHVDAGAGGSRGSAGSAVSLGTLGGEKDGGRREEGRRLEDILV